MRAVDMAHRYHDVPTDATVSRLVREMVAETHLLAKTRRVTTEEGHRSLFGEQNGKWEAFCRRCPTIDPDLFRMAYIASGDGCDTAVS